MLYPGHEFQSGQGSPDYHQGLESGQRLEHLLPGGGGQVREPLHTGMDKLLRPISSVEVPKNTGTCETYAGDIGVAAIQAFQG